ncbi:MULTISPECIES: NAD(P)/FAD-dependent oxidoreductase [unclassified Parvimonas]|uniref:NAD(P)/FAD-dependent oxidoreductase n=1 Tax=unclassified Parvimonas TaxID=1151464 RepID=UPI002B4A900D|nr:MULTISPECIES: FAD-dependent oxidoreductase [unclassified Parvimonas]MEB3024753.1 FAD-dependent oxidoreductase [Parvimonas sp. M13]MEB3088898.1 FAD-dependent oxidoreductase [Parvimonas sp. M20]
MYDCIIIGAGPAGISAGIYAARASMKTIIIEKGTPGGLIAKTDEIANYPGAEDVPTGSELIERMVKQAKSFGAEFAIDTAVNVDLSGTTKVVYGENATYEGKSIIIATGSNPRLLNVPGEKEFTGKGIAYCATCDAPFFQDLDVYVVGSGEAAVEEAMYLTKFGRNVTLLVRKDKLSVAKSIEAKALKREKLKIMWNVEVESFEGTGLLGAMNIVNNKTGEKTKIVPREGDMIFGVFIFVGYIPESSLIEGKIETDRNYIVSNETMKTSVEGVFAAGDVRVKELRQVVTAVNDGAIAAINARKYVESLE